MLKSRKHVFWEALVMTIAIFLVGLYLGMLFESSTANDLSNIYANAEVNMVDSLAISLISDSSSLDCDSLWNSQVSFADRIYEEAKTLEDFEESEQLTKNADVLHRKYDLLRTLLWKNLNDLSEKCNSKNVLVYVYEYKTEDNNKEATQEVLSKILEEVKSNHSEDLILIPIADNTEIISLDLLLAEYAVQNTPAIVVNNQEVIYGLTTPEEIESLLN